MIENSLEKMHRSNLQAFVSCFQFPCNNNLQLFMASLSDLIKIAPYLSISIDFGL